MASAGTSARGCAGATGWPQAAAANATAMAIVATLGLRAAAVIRDVSRREVAVCT